MSADPILNWGDGELSSQEYCNRHEENCREVGSDAWRLKNNLLQMLLFLQVCVDHSPLLPWLCLLLSENIGVL